MLSRCGHSGQACLAGCNFTTFIYGLQHETFLGALKVFLTYFKSLFPSFLAKPEDLDVLFCTLYLAPYGKSKFCIEGEALQLRRRDTVLYRLICTGDPHEWIDIFDDRTEKDVLHFQ